MLFTDKSMSVISGMALQAMDSSHVSLCSLMLKTEAFEAFRFVSFLAFTAAAVAIMVFFFVDSRMLSLKFLTGFNLFSF